MSDENKTEVWQSLMDSAYEKWPEKATKKQFLEILPYQERVAVLLGNYNYQTLNGGHRQWVDNGYALTGDQLIGVLFDIKNASTTSVSTQQIIEQLVDKIKALIGFVDMSAADRGFWEYWIKDGDYDEEGQECNSPGEQFADSLDDWYYKDVQPLLMPAAEAYLISLTQSPIGEQPCPPAPNSPR